MHADTRADEPLSPARQVAALVAAIALAVVAVTGLVLARRYSPNAWLQEELPPAAAWSRRVERAHRVAMLVAAPALVVWGALAIRERARRTGAVVAAALVSLALLALTTRAWQQVRYDQLALWSIPVGGGHGGLWYAAFSDDVRFAFVHGRGEVAPGALAPWVIAYLVAPVLALGLVAVGWAVSRPPRGPRGPRRSVAPAAEPSV